MNTDIILIAMWFSVEFIVLEYADKGEYPIHVMEGRVNGSPSEIVGLTQKRARETAKKHLDLEGRGILTTDVYEVRFSEDLL